MQTHSSCGIILHAFNFRDFDQIVTVFTENEGVIKLIAKQANRSRQGLKNNPLTRAEFVYTIGKSELYVLKEISPQDHYLTLRNNFKSLKTACECLKIILTTQLLHKPAPALYKLLTAYLAKIPHFSNYEAMISSFRLKTLSHEGVLNTQADSFFSKSERLLVSQLEAATSFNELNQIIISPDLNLKIHAFFTDSLS